MGQTSDPSNQNSNPLQQTPPPASPPPASEIPAPLKTPFKLPILVFVIAGILLLAGGVGAAYLFVMQPKPHPAVKKKIAVSTRTPIPDSTANWETYNSITERYLIKYPSEWIVIEAGKTPSDSGAARYDLNEIGGEKEIQKISLAYSDSDLTLFEIAVFDNNSDLTLEEIIKNDTKPSATTAPPNSTEVVKMLKVDEINAVQYSIFGFDRQISVVTFTKNRKVYRITFNESNVNDPDFGKNKKIYNQILSTFKFTD